LIAATALAVAAKATDCTLLTPPLSVSALNGCVKCRKKLLHSAEHQIDTPKAAPRRPWQCPNDWNFNATSVYPAVTEFGWFLAEKLGNFTVDSFRREFVEPSRPTEGSSNA